jgi:hypothetical protein
MNKLKEGFTFDSNSLKMVYVIFFWTLLVFVITKNLPEVVSTKITVVQYQTFFLLVLLMLIENYLTSAVYGSLKDIISSVNFEWKKFFNYGSHFFGRFLLVKIFLVLLLIFVFLLGSILVTSLKYIPLYLQNILYVIFIIWLAFPLFLFCLLLFAPLIIFLEDCSVLVSLKKSFNFLKVHIGNIILISFLFGLIIFFVNFSFKGYNFNSWWWLILKAAILSFGEVGFIKTYFYYYKMVSTPEIIKQESIKENK